MDLEIKLDSDGPRVKATKVNPTKSEVIEAYCLI